MNTEPRVTKLMAAMVLTAFSVGAVFAQASQPAIQIAIDPGQRHQVIQGFGLNYTGPYFRDDQRRMFDMLIDDLGITMFRVVAYLVYSNWEEANDNADPLSANWTYYDERYSGAAFEASWNGMRYLNSRGIRPVLALMGPVPDWMVEEKSAPPKHSVCVPASRQGRLKPEMYDEFAETVVTMAAYARRKAGIEFDYFSPLNETDCYPAEGPRVDPDEMPKVLAAVARRMKQEGLDNVRLLVAEQALLSNDYAGPILKSASLMKNVGAFALHSYSDSSVGPGLEAVRRSAYPETPVWLTEYGSLKDEDKSFANEWGEYSIASVRRALIALNQGASALFYFNAFDDYEECAKRQTFYGLFTSASHIYSPKKRYFAARQLFHFVAPGSQRIAASTDGAALTVSAFRDGAERTLTIVGVKEGGPNRVKISVPVSAASATRRWELYVTTRELDCRKVETIDSPASTLEFDLPAEAIFTLVAGASGAR